MRVNHPRLPGHQLKSNYLARAGFILCMRIAVLIVSLFFCLGAIAQTSAEALHGTATDVAHGTATGPGFTLTLPDSVEMDIAPTSDLALGLNLAQPTHGREWEKIPPRFIGIATRNSDSATLDDLVNRMVADLPSLVPQEITSDGVINLSSMFPAKLGDLPARRLVLEFKNKQKKPSVRQVIVAFRTRPDASPLVYIASLTTTKADFSQDLNLFVKLLAGFKLTPIP